MKMKETPHKILLDRNDPARQMAERFTPQLDLITDLADYASNLIPRAFERSERKLRDVIVCYGFLKQVTAMLDAFDVLARAGAIHAAHLPARAAFEGSLYLEWLLVSDGDKKAAHYVVGGLRAERRWGRRALRGTPEASTFLRQMKHIGQDIMSREWVSPEDAQKFISEADRVLAHQELAGAEAAFEAMATKRGREPEWYKVLGKRNIRAIAEELMRLPEYVLHYAKGSEVMHSSSYADHVRFGSAGSSGTPVRSLIGVDYVLNFVVSNAIHTFMRVLGFYRVDEMPWFSTKYVTDWRAPFLRIPHVRVQAITPKRP